MGVVRRTSIEDNRENKAVSSGIAVPLRGSVADPASVGTWESDRLSVAPTTMENRGEQVVSFDVFDTVLTRRVGDPRALFLLVGRRAAATGVLDCSANAFAKARRAAEIRAFRNAGGLDSSVSLIDIYHEVAHGLHLSEADEARLVELEMQVEHELLTPIQLGVDRVRAERVAGKRIIFVSDMYLPSAFIEAQLRRFNIFEAGDELFVSNELQLSKSTGRIWPHVLRTLDVNPSQIHHIGNDANSDGKRTSRAGLSTEVLSNFNLNRYEVSLESHHSATDGLSSAIAGASRLARLGGFSDSEQVIADVAAGVVAPFVLGNLLWTLDVAKREGLTKLFFVARDGQLLHEIAQKLAVKVGYEGELVYTYGSRQAWSLASITDSCTLAIDSTISVGDDLTTTLRDTLRRLELEPEDIAESLTANGFPSDRWDNALLPADGLRLRQIIVDDDQVFQRVKHQAKLSRDRILSYLDSVGAITNEPIGFVDLGTGATLFNALSSILETVGQKPPRGFYFGLRSSIPDSGFGRPLTYVRSEDDRLGYLRTPGLLTLVELACTADHGSVVGYEDVGGVVEPVFASDGNAAVVDWGLPIVRETVCRVAEELVTDSTLVGVSSVDLRPAVLDVFNLFWTTPTRSEAAVWGAYPFEDGWGEESIRHPIAERRTMRDIVNSAPHRHWWNEGSARLSGPVTRRAMNAREVAMHNAKRVQSKLRERIST